MKRAILNHLRRSKFSSVVDGNTAAAYVAFGLTETSYIFPITPASPMAEKIDEYISAGTLNCFGQPVKLIEMQSEGGVAGSMHGALLAGSLSSSYTASQGLLLMIPNLYKMAYEMLPGVVHVSARAVGGQAINIFGDHSDAMACRQTGLSMLCSGSVQEAHDFALVSHLASIKSLQPFMHFFDGFRTSHEINKIELLDYDEIFDMVDLDELQAFRERGLNTEDPHMFGSVEHNDMFFQMTERINTIVDMIPEKIGHVFDQVFEATGRRYEPFQFFGSENPEHLIVSMGSSSFTVKEAVDILNERGENVGGVKVNLFRPWIADSFIDTIPSSVKKITVLDRTKESGSYYEPLCLDVIASVSKSERFENVEVLGGRYGLGGFEFTPCMVSSVFDNMKESQPKDHFLVGIDDDLTDRSIDFTPRSCLPEDSGDRVECLFYGIGGDGTVGANHKAIEIIGHNTDLQTQAYFAYDAKKSGGLTVSHLRFGPGEPIQNPYYIQNADYVACHFTTYLEKYDMLENIKEGGVFVLNSPWNTLEELEKNLPLHVKKRIGELGIKFYQINAQEIARSVGLGKRINMVMQTVFFFLSEVITPIDDAIKLLKDSIVEEFSRKGDDIVRMNIEGVDKALDGMIEISVPSSWAEISDLEIAKEMEMKKPKNLPKHIEDILVPYSEGKGHTIPLSVCPPGGAFISGSTRYEKRGVAPTVPLWDPEHCLQANHCVFVCPHAAIRPFLMTEEEVSSLPKSQEWAESKDELIEYAYSIGVSVLDCEGCGQCVEACSECGDKTLEDTNALEMVTLEEAIDAGGVENWEYLFEEVSDKARKLREEGIIDIYDVKGVSFLYPYFEFSGACGGCGEASYYKLVSQLFGDRMMIGNATGCTSVYCNYAPSQAFCADEEGIGPAWASSLFEDNSEFSLGIQTGNTHRRDFLKEKVKKLVTKEDVHPDLNEILTHWINNFDDQDESLRYGREIKEWLDSSSSSSSSSSELVNMLRKESDLLAKKSFWCVGGDGFAFDIGFGGLIHVLSTGEDLNVLILNSQVYSNTGGQASKATPMGASAKFTSSGKVIPQMDLGLIAVSLGGVYVASCSMGADQKQLLTAIKEANEYDGPSIILCYCPCIAHGVQMSLVQEEEKLAVESGFYPLYRYHPETGFSYDSKDMVDIELMDQVFENEIRFKTVMIVNPEKGEVLQKSLKEDALKKHEYLLKLEDLLKVQ